jgi:hypothetical protein
MTTLNVLVPSPTPAPRGAAWLGDQAAGLLKHLQRATHLKRAERLGDAARVRALAHDYEQTDPRMAADLYAAADHDEAVQGN